MGLILLFEIKTKHINYAPLMPLMESHIPCTQICYSWSSAKQSERENENNLFINNLLGKMATMKIDFNTKRLYHDFVSRKITNFSHN